MKNLLILSIFTFLFSVTTLQAQSNYTVDGKSYDLKTEVEGSLTLLWNVIDSDFRYFLKKGENITELKNTKVDGRFQEEYKETLDSQTTEAAQSTKNVRFTLPDLSAFFIAYNRALGEVIEDKTPIRIHARLGGFIGISNNIYALSNVNNEMLPVAGIDFELLESSLPRHALVLQFKQNFENSDYKYSSSQVSFNYRFKFIKKEKIDVFINAKFAAYTHITRDIAVENDDNSISIVSNSTGDFQALGNFGIGADYALGNGYITFSYNDIIGLSLDTNDEFPIDFTLGYKFNL